MWLFPHGLRCKWTEKEGIIIIISERSDAQWNFSPRTDQCPVSPQAAAAHQPTPPVLLLSMMPYIRRHPFGQVTCAGSVPFQFCGHPLVPVHYEKLECPWLSVRTALQQLRHHCVINTVLILNLQHNYITIPTTRK